MHGSVAKSKSSSARMKFLQSDAVWKKLSRKRAIVSIVAIAELTVARSSFLVFVPLSSTMRSMSVTL